MVYRVAADIGGTFTDIVIENKSEKNFLTIKVLSTPQNQAIAVLEGLKKNIPNINADMVRTIFSINNIPKFNYLVLWGD